MQAINQEHGTAEPQHYAYDGADSVTEALCNLQALLMGQFVSEDEANSGATMGNVVAQLSHTTDTISGLGLTGLHNMFVALTERVLPFAKQDGIPSDLADALQEWVQLSFSYLTEPLVHEHRQALIDFLNRPLWREQLSEGQVAILNRLFEITSPGTATPMPPSEESAEADAAAALVSVDFATSTESAITVEESADAVIVDVSPEIDADGGVEIPAGVAELSR